MTQYCTFHLGEKIYGLEILSIQEIVRHLEITPVPQSPPFVAGLANLRGQIVVAVDLRNLFGMPRLPRPQDSINIILSSEEESLSLLADRAGEVIDFGDEAMVPRLSQQRDPTSDLVKGVFKLKDSLLNVIDTDAIFKNRNVLDAQSAQAGFAGGTDVR